LQNEETRHILAMLDFYIVLSSERSFGYKDKNYDMEVIYGTATWRRRAGFRG
jgi:hypothetical protein